MLSLSGRSELATVVEGRVCLMYLQQTFRETLLPPVILPAGFTPLPICYSILLVFGLSVQCFFFLIKQACA